jgi:hypothetical protein
MKLEVKQKLVFAYFKFHLSRLSPYSALADARASGFS